MRKCFIGKKDFIFIQQNQNINVVTIRSITTRFRAV